MDVYFPFSQIINNAFIIYNFYKNRKWMITKEAQRAYQAGNLRSDVNK